MYFEHIANKTSDIFNIGYKRKKIKNEFKIFFPK